MYLKMIKVAKSQKADYFLSLAVEHLFITFWRFCCCAHTICTKKWWRDVQLHKGAFIINDFLRNPHFSVFQFFNLKYIVNSSKNLRDFFFLWFLCWFYLVFSPSNPDPQYFCPKFFLFFIFQDFLLIPEPNTNILRTITQNPGSTVYVLIHCRLKSLGGVIFGWKPG